MTGVIEKTVNHMNFLTYNGETLHLAEWARRYQIGEETLRWRIKKGWDVEKALTKKSITRSPKKMITYNGESKSLEEWARITGISYYTLTQRIRKGWSVEKILESSKRHGGRICP